MGADFTLVVAGFLAAKSAVAEVKRHEVSPPFSVQACCVWVRTLAEFAEEEGFFVFRVREGTLDQPIGFESLGATITPKF